MGGCGGLLLAIWGLGAMRTLLPEGMIPRADENRFGLAGTSLLFWRQSLLTGIVFGLAPAWRTLRVDVNGALKEGASKIGQALLRGRLRGVFSRCRSRAGPGAHGRRGLVAQNLCQFAQR